MKKIRLAKSDIHRGPLILVNSSYTLREEHPQQLVSVTDKQPEILLANKAASTLARLLRDLGAGSAIVPVSGYRSRYEQESLYDESVQQNGQEFTQKFVARPGCSEHQTGLAIDLGKMADDIDFIRPHFPDDGICGRFLKEAPRYGFILRYENGKEPITGIAYEPWHFRYVGFPHAEIMRTHGFCLEEYLSFLKEHTRQNPLRYIFGNRNIEVFYQALTDEATELELPAECLHQISGNNIDGFVVTIWKNLAGIA